MQDTIVITWHRKLFPAQIAALQNKVEQYGEDTQIVEGGGHGADAAWVTSTVPVADYARHHICQTVRDYFRFLDREAAARKMNKLARRSRHAFALDSQSQIICTFARPLTGYQAGQDEAQRLANHIPGARVIDVAQRERQAMVEYLGCTIVLD